MKWITSDDENNPEFMRFESPKFVGEGMSAVSFESVDGNESVLMTFGGYNGSCGNDLQVYKLPNEFPNEGYYNCQRNDDDGEDDDDAID